MDLDHLAAGGSRDGPCVSVPMVSPHWLRIFLLSLLGNEGPQIRGTNWPGSGGDLVFRLLAESDVGGRKNSLVLRTFFQQRET